MTTEQKAYCSRCAFYTRECGGVCDYLEITGHMRGGRVGPECSRRVLRRGNEDVERLYREGRTDREIAEACGMTRRAVLDRRLGMGLRREQKPHNAVLDKEDVRRRLLRGETDREIAEAYGVKEGTVKACRNRMGIKKNK